MDPRAAGAEDGTDDSMITTTYDNRGIVVPVVEYTTVSITHAYPFYLSSGIVIRITTRTLVCFIRIFLSVLKACSSSLARRYPETLRNPWPTARGSRDPQSGPLSNEWAISNLLFTISNATHPLYSVDKTPSPPSSPPTPWALGKSPSGTWNTQSSWPPSARSTAL